VAPAGLFFYPSSLDVQREIPYFGVFFFSFTLMWLFSSYSCPDSTPRKPSDRPAPVHYFLGKIAGFFFYIFSHCSSAEPKSLPGPPSSQPLRSRSPERRSPKTGLSSFALTSSPLFSLQTRPRFNFFWLRPFFLEEIQAFLFPFFFPHPLDILGG